MPFLADRVLDLGLNVLDAEATHIYICTSEPATFAAAQTARLGTKALGASGIGAPLARTPSGRRVQLAAFADGAVTTGGNASHWAVVDEANSRLLAAGGLSAAQAVTAGNTWSLPLTDIAGIPGA